MGRLIDGKWHKTSVITSDQKGAYARVPRSFLDTINETHEVFQPASGRYHLYVSYACPWAHRTLIYRGLKSLEQHISVDVVHPDMLDEGWTFEKDTYGANGDSIFDFKYLREVYQKVDPQISTTVTVPILFDKKTQRVVNNESSQIIRIFNDAFNKLTGNTNDYYPEALRSKIDAWNDEIYPTINNGVYKCGFARTQAAYDLSIQPLFKMLDKIEAHLDGRAYLVGEQLTEADIRLIPTLLRFDDVYFTHFKCNRQMIRDFKNLSAYVKRLYEYEAIQNTTNWSHIKRHYYYSHASINPHRIVPSGPGNWLEMI